ncbi:hypothetical protein H632_c1836p0, partial [Helicosporidium sp. ATCC 50920]
MKTSDFCLDNLPTDKNCWGTIKNALEKVVAQSLRDEPNEEHQAQYDALLRLVEEAGAAEQAVLARCQALSAAGVAEAERTRAADQVIREDKVTIAALQEEEQVAREAASLLRGEMETLSQLLEAGTAGLGADALRVEELLRQR